MGIIDTIRQKQANLPPPVQIQPPKHSPEMLYIGCVDARLDPNRDLGIEYGKALIFRNIGAMVAKPSSGSANNESIGAVLEFFLEHLPATEDGKKHIVVSGHTKCGGINACYHGACSHDHYLPKYLENFKEALEKIVGITSNKSDEEKLHDFEQESVRQSIANLKAYPAVKKALEDGKVEVHGWVLDTATKQISEMDPATGEFKLMREKYPELAGRKMSDGYQPRGGWGSR